MFSARLFGHFRCHGKLFFKLARIKLGRHPQPRSDGPGSRLHQGVVRRVPDVWRFEYLSQSKIIDGLEYPIHLAYRDTHYIGVIFYGNDSVTRHLVRAFRTRNEKGSRNLIKHGLQSGNQIDRFVGFAIHPILLEPRNRILDDQEPILYRTVLYENLYKLLHLSVGKRVCQSQEKYTSASYFNVR